MWFSQTENIDKILELIRPKLKAVLSGSKHGIDIEIKPHKRNRSTDQNSYLWAVYSHIVEFYHQTGFIVDNLPLRFITSDFLHEYFKSRFDRKTTTNMSTVEFMNYTDSIQQLIIEQTHGHYDPIYPPERYQEF